MSSAVSLGAGGHLNGVEVTPTTTRPPANAVEHVAQREGPGDGVELVTRLEQSGRRRRVEVGAERDHQDVRRRTVPASVSTRLVTGSIARTSTGRSARRAWSRSA